MAMQNSPARPGIDVGSVIAGTYTIEALVGRGGMGAVFLASHNRLPGKKVAIKVLHGELGDEEISQRFRREAKIAALLSHPNIVHIEDYNVTSDGMPYLVLEYLQGESLSQRLKRGPLTHEQVTPIIRQVGSALAAAHAKGVIHRDLKPANIFIQPSEIDGHTHEIAKVLDFGISKMRDSETVKTQESALLGTPQYMAPEQATGKHDLVDERTDIFALGAIVYEMLAGAPAFTGQTIPEVVFKVVYEQPIKLAERVRGLDPHVVAAVEKALAKSQSERFPSVTAFIEALTGSPVSVIRSALSIPPPDGNAPSSGSRTPNTGREAFDKTLGSGDYTVPPPSTTADVVRVDAITVASQDGRAPVLAPDFGTAGTIASSERPSIAAPPPPVATSPAPGSKKTIAMVGGVLAAAVAAAGIMYVVMRREPPARPTTAASDPPIAESQPPKVETPPPVEKQLLEAQTGSGSAVLAAAVGSGSAEQPKQPKQPKLPKQPVETSDEPTNTNTNAGAKLAEAMAFLDQKKWDEAGQAAAIAFGDEHATAHDKIKATMIKGIVSCRKNNQEGGLSAYRALSSVPKLRKRLVTACKAAGYELE